MVIQNVIVVVAWYDLIWSMAQSIPLWSHGENDGSRLKNRNRNLCSVTIRVVESIVPCTGITFEQRFHESIHWFIILFVIRYYIPTFKRLLSLTYASLMILSQNILSKKMVAKFEKYINFKIKININMTKNAFTHWFWKRKSAKRSKIWFIR